MQQVLALRTFTAPVRGASLKIRFSRYVLDYDLCMSTAARAAPGLPERVPIGRRTKREQRDVSIEKLLCAARSLIVSKGYRSTTLDQVATAAGLTKGAVYFHFGSKEALLVQLLDRAENQLVVPALEILESPGDPVSEKLVQFMRLHGEMGVTNREDMLLLIAMSIEFAELEGPAADAIRRIYSDFHRVVEVLIRSGQANGEFRRDAPATELASVVIATHDGAFLEWYRRGSQLDGGNLVRATLSVLLHGL